MRRRGLVEYLLTCEFVCDDHQCHCCLEQVGTDAGLLGEQGLGLQGQDVRPLDSLIGFEVLHLFERLFYWAIVFLECFGEVP